MSINVPVHTAHSILTFPVILFLIWLGTMHRGPVSPASPHLKKNNSMPGIIILKI